MVTMNSFPRETTTPVHPLNSANWKWIQAFTLILVCGLLLATIRPGHYWGDDFAQYLQHAKNIAQGRPYAQTGYLYNPLNPVVGPRSYPPMFSIVLAPVSYMFGTNLIAYKVLMVLMIILTLWVVARLLTYDLSGRELWIVITILGFSPIAWEIKDSLISEHLFSLLFYATILVAEDWYRRRSVYRTPFLHGVILGLLIGLTCLTRTVGVILLPTLLLCELLIARRATQVGIIAFVSAVGLLVAERILLPSSGGGYLEQLNKISVTQLLSNLHNDVMAFTLVWQNGYSRSIARFAGLALIVTGGVGYLVSLRKSVSPLGIAVAAYFTLVVIWPSADGLRMILPLLPAFLFYVISGLGSFSPSPTWRSAAMALFLLFSLLSDAAYYSRANLGPIGTGVDVPSSQELFQFIRQETEPDEIIVFFKPRALALFTNRSVSAYPVGTDAKSFWDYARSINARYIIVRPDASQQIYEDKTLEMEWNSQPEDLREVFRNSAFRVYRWNRTTAAVSMRNLQGEAR